MKCVDCGTEIKEESVEKELRVTLHNPGNVSAKGKVFECPNPKCQQHYVDMEEALRFMDRFEANRLEKNKIINPL